jgi:hypothetical protein
MKVFQSFLHSITLCADPSGRSLAGFVGSSSAGVMDVCLLLVCCQVKFSVLADHSPPLGLPSMACLSVAVKPQ